MGDQRVCFTAHNFSRQGIADESLLWATGVCNPARFFEYERLRDNFNPAALNLMKGGIVYSNLSRPFRPRARPRGLLAMTTARWRLRRAREPVPRLGKAVDAFLAQPDLAPSSCRSYPSTS